MSQASSTLPVRLNKEIKKLLSHSTISRWNDIDISSLTFDTFLANKRLIIMAIRNGIPHALFQMIQESSPFNEAEWAEILDCSQKSLQRYKSEPDFRFKSIHSEKIIAMAEVTKAGVDVFGSMEAFKAWLHTPSFALGNETPMELLKDSYGKELVLAELVHIDHGILV